MLTDLGHGIGGGGNRTQYLLEGSQTHPQPRHYPPSMQFSLPSLYLFCASPCPPSCISLVTVLVNKVLPFETQDKQCLLNHSSCSNSLSLSFSRCCCRLLSSKLYIYVMLCIHNYYSIYYQSRKMQKES